MAMHKAIKSGKEHRVEYGTKGQPYCKAIDRTCRNHGGRPGGAANQCPWCLGNRINKEKQKEKIAKEKVQEYNNIYSLEE